MKPYICIGRPCFGLVLFLLTTTIGFSQPKQNPIDSVIAALNSSSPERQWAAITSMPSLKITPEQSGILLKELVAFLPKATTSELQIAWLRSYGRLHLRPTDLTQESWIMAYASFPRAVDSARRIESFLSREPKPYPREVRRAAAESLSNLVTAMVQKVGKPSIPLLNEDRDIEPQQRIALGLGVQSPFTILPWLYLFNGVLDEFNASVDAYLALISSVLDSRDPEEVKSGLEAIRQFGVVISDNLPDPMIKREKDLTVNPYEAKVKWLLLLPAQKTLNQVTGKIRFALQMDSTEIKILASRSVEAVALARRLALVTRDYEPSPGLKLMDLPEDDLLVPSLKSLLPDLLKNLKSSNEFVRMATMESLEYYESAAFEVREQIIGATQDPRPLIRWVAARTLGRMAPKDPKEPVSNDILQALIRMLKDQDIDARIAAMTSLQKFGERAIGATDAVIESVGRGDVDSRTEAIHTLEVIKSEGPAVVKTLAKALDDDDIRVKRAAAVALGKLGPKAEGALPALRKTLNDDDIDLRRLASEAILTIEK